MSFEFLTFPICFEFRISNFEFRIYANRIRKGSAPQLLAALCNADISLLRTLGVTNIAEAIRENVCKVDDTLTKFGILNL